MSRKGLALDVAALVLVAITAACSNNEASTQGDRTSEAAVTTGATATVSPSSTPSGGSLPAGFPGSFPIPDGAVVVDSIGVSGGYMLGFSIYQTREELCSFFDNHLPGNGWTIQSKTNETDSHGKPFTDYEISGHGFTGNIYVHGSSAPAGEYPVYVGLFRG
jgi:hypothetical protein